MQKTREDHSEKVETGLQKSVQKVITNNQQYIFFINTHNSMTDNQTYILPNIRKQCTPDS